MQICTPQLSREAVQFQSTIKAIRMIGMRIPAQTAFGIVGRKGSLSTPGVRTQTGHLHFSDGGLEHLIPLHKVSSRLGPRCRVCGGSQKQKNSVTLADITGK